MDFASQVEQDTVYHEQFSNSAVSDGSPKLCWVFLSGPPVEGGGMRGVPGGLGHFPSKLP